MDTQTWIYVLTLVVLAGQLWVFDKQRQIVQLELEWRRDEAIARFYQLGLKLAANFSRMDGVGATLNPTPTLANPVPVDLTFDHELLPELTNAATRFAPLGRVAVRRLVAASFSLQQYLLELERHAAVSKGDEPNWLARLKVTRATVGLQLDRAAAEIPVA